jgi:hypothetical protein
MNVSEMARRNSPSSISGCIFNAFVIHHDLFLKFAFPFEDFSEEWDDLGLRTIQRISLKIQLLNCRTFIL